MSKHTMTTALQLKNVTKIEPVRWQSHDDDMIPYGELSVAFSDNDDIVYGVFSVVAYDTIPSVKIIKTASPTSITGKISLTTSVVTNAYTTLKTAEESTVGNRSAKRDAVLAAAIAAGLIAADFAYTG